MQCPKFNREQKNNAVVCFQKYKFKNNVLLFNNLIQGGCLNLEMSSILNSMPSRAALPSFNRLKKIGRYYIFGVFSSSTLLRAIFGKTENRKLLLFEKKLLSM